MNRETIEKAALQHAMRETGLDYIGEVACENGFIAGAKWRINSVWHDADKEEPVYWKLIIRKDRFGDCDLGCGLTDDTVSWAYVSDLLPERKEKGDKQ